jgi:hypothetical protein
VGCSLNERRIKTDPSLDRLWGLFLYFESTPTTKDYLFRSYSRLESEKDATRLAFENTQKLIYLLKQGAAYFNSAKHSDIIVRPLLLYYGITSLMKAIILIKDPYYPRTTSVLQHGITTRKKKKSNYIFQQDEIKVQKDGLLPLFSQLVIADPLKLHSKYKVSDLFGLIPELQDSFSLLFQRKTMINLRVTRESPSSCIFSFSKKELEENSLAFSDAISMFPVNILANEEIVILSEEELSFTLITSKSCYLPERDNAQIFRDYRGDYFFYFRNPLSISNDIIVYNMLMYILGMLCRYDTELWGEILFSFNSNDLFIIEEFLNLALRKFPNLILNQLFNETIIFEC